MIPSQSDPRWGRLIDTPEQCTYQALPLRVLMQRIVMKKRLGLTPQTRAELIGEMHKFFLKNQRVIQKDIVMIFG